MTPTKRARYAACIIMGVRSIIPQSKSQTTSWTNTANKKRTALAEPELSTACITRKELGRGRVRRTACYSRPKTSRTGTGCAPSESNSATNKAPTEPQYKTALVGPTIYAYSAI